MGVPGELGHFLHSFNFELQSFHFSPHESDWFDRWPCGLCAKKTYVTSLFCLEWIGMMDGALGSLQNSISSRLVPFTVPIVDCRPYQRCRWFHFQGKKFMASGSLQLFFFFGEKTISLAVSGQKVSKSSNFCSNKNVKKRYRCRFGWEFWIRSMEQIVMKKSPSFDEKSLST